MLYFKYVIAYKIIRRNYYDRKITSGHFAGSPRKRPTRSAYLANWTVWDDLGFEMKPGNESYDFAFSQISKGEEVTISVEWNGLSMPGFISVSVQKLNSSTEFFKHVLEACEKGHYEDLSHSFR